MSIDIFFERVCNLWPEVFSDLAWSKNPLAIPLPNEKISSMRFALQEKECLHLRHVQVFKEDAGRIEKIDLAGAELSLSSCYKGAEFHLTEKSFINEAPFIGFHTNSEENPWAEIVFPEPISADVMKLTNRNDEYSNRAKTLEISCTTAEGKSLILYDALNRIKEAERWLLQQYIDLVGDTDSYQKICADLIISIARWDKDTASRIFLKNKFFHTYRKNLNKISELYNLEFTIHGLTRSFRYWKRHEKQEYLKFGKEVADSLAELGAQACFGFGAILGFVRTGDFIDHDDDLDLLVSFDKKTVPTINDGLTLIENHLRAIGYKVEGDFFSHRWVYSKKGHQLDVFIGLIEGEQVSVYPARRNAYQTDDLFPPAMIDFLNVKSPMPKNIMEYLRKTYGDDWRTPNGSFGHKWDESAYADIK